MHSIVPKSTTEQCIDIIVVDSSLSKTARHSATGQQWSLPNYQASVARPVIKHIPRSARPHIASELIKTIDQLLSAPFFPSDPVCSTFISGAGRRHNITSTLTARTMPSDFSTADFRFPLHQPYPLKTSTNQTL